MKKSFEAKAQSGVIKKLVRMEPGTSRGKGMAFLPKVTGKVRKTFMNDSMKVQVRAKTTSPIVSRMPGTGSLKRIAKGGTKNA